MYSFQKPLLSSVIGWSYSIQPVSKVVTKSKPIINNILFFKLHFLLTSRYVHLFSKSLSQIYVHLALSAQCNQEYFNIFYREALLKNAIRQIFLPHPLSPVFGFFKTFPTFKTCSKLFFTSCMSISAVGFRAMMM